MTAPLKDPGESEAASHLPKKDEIAKTARLDVGAAGEEEESSTKRKTIRVKRPTDRPGVRNVTLARAPGAAAPSPSMQPAGVTHIEDSAGEPGAFFAVAAVLTFLMSAGLLVVLVKEFLIK